MKILFLLVLLSIGYAIEAANPQKPNLKNGTFIGESRSHYTDEPYWGKVTLQIRNGQIADVKFQIRDSAKHEPFNEKYEVHFANIPEYVQQCRNDWEGVQNYPKEFLKKQDIDQLDAVSGATWSFNIFIELGILSIT